MQRQELEQIIKIGARGSPLSLAQSGQLRALLGRSLGLAARDFEHLLPLIPIVTTGDKIQDRPLSEAGGKGLFTKELDDALLDGRIDCAIHSLKDVPTVLPDGIILLTGPKREDRHDALVSLEGLKLSDIRAGGIIGSASLRRGAQLQFQRPDLKIVTLRGNVGTRLEKLRAGGIDATLLAAAGLARLGLTDVPHVLLDPHEMPPAIGQGALAITVRAGDVRLIEAFAAISDPETALETAAERAFLTALDGCCRTAIGALTHVSADGCLTLLGETFSEDGRTRFRRTEVAQNATLESAWHLGFQLGLQIKADVTANQSGSPP
jgi:hydroxymethylbilane synthase